MAYVNVAEWNPEHVADWLRGLDDEIQPYTQFFINNKVNGCQLLTLARDDLTNLNMTKIGHQELVLDAVDLLRQLHYNLTSETLQSLALKLGCKAQSLFNDLKRVCQDFADTGKKERVSADTLSAVSDIINLVKSLISWLDRYPFVGQDIYVDVRKTILKLSIELASTAQRDQFAENPHKIIKETCLKIASQSDKIVQEFNDSLIIQPASLEVAKIKRKVDDDMGIHINSLYTGIHIIEDIKFQSPAYRSGKVEEGDEIVQINYQTVIGWQVKNIICAMKEHPSEVHLTLKKRPRHPNVLGQVITLWPYRIPSKKTAFRKLYKWSKGKDIRDLCPKSPGTRTESNSVSEVNGSMITDKEKLFAVNKPRNRLRRRATVTGVSPTTLQAPVSLEELIGNSSKRKESVLRTISYDPNKTVDLEDNVFKRDLQSGDQDDKQESLSTKAQEVAEATENEPKEPKSPFLRPPQEKYMVGHLRRQEALKNSETVARAGVAKPSPLSVAPNPPPPKPPLRPPMQQQNATTDASIIQDVMPSGNQSPKSKLADWVNKQKKKPEVGLLQHALTLFSQDSTTAPPSPGGKESGSPQSSRSTGSPKVKKGAATMFQFPFREGRPSLSELRGLKRAANSKVFSERVSSTQGEKSVTSPKHHSAQRRNQMAGKKPGLAVKPTKDIRMNPSAKEDSWKYKDIPKLPDNYVHPKCINYTKIPQYPCEMHESKIVSLKSRTNGTIPQVNNRSNTQQIPAPNVTRNMQHYQRARQMARLTSQGSSTLIRNQKSGYPKAFYSPSGRSLSFNNLVINSDDSSSDEEYEIYEELCDDSQPVRQEPVHNVPPAYSEVVDPNFARHFAEVYNMLAQRQNVLQNQVNSRYRGQMNVPNAAIIDELALRMYHALRMNHMKAQNSYQQPQTRPVELKNTAALKNIAMRNTVVPNKPPRTNCYPVVHPSPPKPQSYSYNNEFHPEKNGPNAVREHPVDLPPSGYLPSRNGNHVFKSATSQEIHNLYTSRTGSKGSVSTLHENDNVSSFPVEENEKDHTYETIPYQKAKYIDDLQDEKCDEKVFLYPAEKEFEPELPCKDNDVIDVIDNRIPDHLTANPNFKTMKDNVFCPIKEDISLKSHHFDNCSAFKPVVTNRQTSNIASQINCNGNDENQINNFINIYDKNIQPAISSLIMNIPKPPTEAYSPTAMKCSSSQTDSELCNINDDKQSVYLNNDESFNSLNCTNNSVNESQNFSSSSSLNSSSSGSTISSSGSCYYYVDTQNKTQFPIKCALGASESGEDVPLIDLRSPTLPTMGVSMLSKKRSTSSSGSEHSSNAGSRASPNVPVIIESDVSKATKIVTDVEHII